MKSDKIKKITFEVPPLYYLGKDIEELKERLIPQKKGDKKKK